MKRLNACLYLPQLSPIADFRLVYSGSRSMRWIVLEAFAAFVDSGGSTPFALESDREAGVAVVIPSGRLSAAGSISIPGMAGTGERASGGRLGGLRAPAPHQDARSWITINNDFNRCLK